MYTVHFLADAEILDDSLQTAISEVVSSVYLRISELIKIGECSVLVTTNKRIRDSGVFTSYSGDAEGFYIAINPKMAMALLKKGSDIFNSKIQEHILAGLYATARSRNHGEETEYTLLEEIVEEGLIAHFIEEILGTKQDHHGKLSNKEIDQLKSRMKEDCKDGSCDINNWFIGTTDGLPHNQLQLLDMF